MGSVQDTGGGDQGPLVNVLTWVFTSLSTIFVALRLVSRLKLKHNAGLDDAAIVIALIVNILYSVVISIAVSKGTGTRAATLASPQAAVEAGKWNVVAIETGIFSFGLPKVAIALLLGRILTIRRSLCWLLYAMAGTLIVYAVVQDVVFIEQCDPVEGAWNRSIKAKCWDPWPVTVSGIVYSCMYAHGDHANVPGSQRALLNMWLRLNDLLTLVLALSAFLDLFYAILPAVLIFKLNMSSRKKINLTIMMGLGVVAGVIAIYKTTKLPALASPKADFTWATAPLLYWSSIEANCVIISACIPTINPVIQLFVEKTKPWMSTTNKSAYSNGARGTSNSCAGRGTITDPRDPAESDSTTRKVRLKRDKHGWFELSEVEQAATPDER
ncbi:MAG: hypothetical protein Q9162_006634 [Coniocarpon cinnabarinum]